MPARRIADGFHEQIEAVIGKPIGSDFPYAAPGWEPETDAKDWIGDIPHAGLPEFAHGWTHGTSEKLHALDANYVLGQVIRVGDWPRLELINDDASLLKAALATSPLGGMPFSTPAIPQIDAPDNPSGFTMPPFIWPFKKRKIIREFRRLCRN